MADDALDLDAEIRALYAGEPGDFVAGRTALAKRVKDAGRGDDAGAVKALRKPERRAWALDRAAADDPEAMLRLVESAAAVGQAQEGGGDVRAAATALRDAVRKLAARAPDTGAATADLVAVVADPDALDALVAGRLVQVPEGGGFGPLALGGSQAAAPARAPATKRPTEKAAVTPAEERKQAREAERRAAETVKEAERQAAARRREAKAALDDAEAVLRRAGTAHDKAVRNLEAAERDERDAASKLADAEQAVETARNALEALD